MNLRGAQTPALGRMLTVVRSLSTEGLNLKTKTKGDDKTDSMVKFRIFDLIRGDVQSTADQLYAEGGVVAAREWLASLLQENFQRMGYGNELSLGDFMNVAHILIREIPTGVKVLSVGHLNSIVLKAVSNARNASESGIDLDAALEAAREGLQGYSGAELDLDGVLAGFRVSTQSSSNGGVHLGIESPRSASIGRNVALVQQILAENPDIIRRGEEQLDYLVQGKNETGKEFDNEADRVKAHKMAIALSAASARWSEYTREWKKDWREGSPRNSYRVIGVLGRDSSWDGILSIGFKNAWVVDARATKAAETVIRAYKLGLTVFLEGTVSLSEQEAESFWKAVADGTGGKIDAAQGVPLDHTRTLLPMFDIRLNGGNTTLDTGTINAGTFWAPSDNIHFYYENPFNELGLGDSEFAATRSFVQSVHPMKTGDYEVSGRVAFANLFDWMRNNGPVEAITTKTGAKLFGDSPHLEKDQAKADRANKYIGRGSEKSSTAGYAKSFGTRANMGFYYANDVVFISAEEKQEGRLDPDFDEIKKATDAGATIITDNLVNRIRKHNEGERQVAQFLEQEGYVEDNGTWTPGPSHAIFQANRDNVSIRVATKQEIKRYLKKNKETNALEFTGGMTVDTGTDVIQDSSEDIALREGMAKYASKFGQVKSDGILRDAIPGEIVAWLRAEVGDKVVYHPIRPFESDNAGGAPATLRIKSIDYSQETEGLVVSWEHTGTMEGRAFKIFEALYGANKYMARSVATDDIELKNGMRIAGQIAMQSTLSRRLHMRRRQKMMSLMYMARMSPYGYNLAEHDGTFPTDKELKARLLTGDATLSEWDQRLKAEGGIAFYPRTEQYARMNQFANEMAKKAIMCGINPTDVFASRFDTARKQKVPSNIWFNFQVLFGEGPAYQAGLMNYLNYMMPTLVPAQSYTAIGDRFVDDGKTLFNKDLQVLVPWSGKDESGNQVSGEHWVDLYGGFHFLDEHYSGYSGAGATSIKPIGMPSINTLLAGGFRTTPRDIDLYLDWANAGDSRNVYSMPYMFLPESSAEVD